MKRKAYYPVTHTQIGNFSVSSGFQHVSIDNAFFRPIPDRILVALVNNSAFVDSASTNPYHFHHYDMTKFVLYVNGVQHPFESLRMDLSSPFRATRAYETLTFIHHDDSAHDSLRNVH